MKSSTSLRLSLGAVLLTFAVSAAAQNAVTEREVTVRAGPDRSYPEVAELDADTPIQVMGCLDDWSWCDVGFGDDRGWVYAPAITYEYQGGYVPLYSYAPGLGIPVVAFSLDSYWGSHYHERSWYGQREEWMHRGPPRHERPPGPAPNSGPPPREAIAARPRGESRNDQSFRLSRAPPSRQNAEPRDQPAEPRDRAPRETDRAHRDATDHGAVGATRTSEDRPPAETPRAEAGAEARFRSNERSATQNSAPQNNEQRSRPVQHAAPAERKEERPSAPPPNREPKDDRPHEGHQ